MPWDQAGRISEASSGMDPRLVGGFHWLAAAAGGLPPGAWRLPDSWLSLSSPGTPVPPGSIAGRVGPPGGRFHAASSELVAEGTKSASKSIGERMAQVL